MVYEEVVVVGKVFYTPSEHDIWNGKRCQDHQLYRKPELQLLRVCKKIHDEAECAYLSKNLFVLPIRWFECQPFRKLDHFHIRDSESDTQYLFSEAGLSHIKNVSIAIDQKLAGDFNMGFNRWKYEEHVLHNTPFEQLSPQERLDRVHESARSAFGTTIIAMNRQLAHFKTPLRYFEVDFTNAFCPFGDCRLIAHAAMFWFRGASPAVLDILGLKASTETRLFTRLIDLWISQREVKAYDVLRYKKVGDVTPWDKWRAEGEIEDKSAHLRMWPMTTLEKTINESKDVIT